MPSKVFNELSNLITESTNKNSEDIDRISSLEIVNRINLEDQKCADAVSKAAQEIADAIDLIAKAFNLNGRLFYIGAGTSGRLGVLDASECPPTFGSDPEQVQGIIAGGLSALVEAKEGSEDVDSQGWLDLKEKKPTANDVVCGIMASGRTPYVIGALKQAKENQIPTISISCNGRDNLKFNADVNICVDAGPEIIMGSTRMKSGTMQKMILNMLTTGAFIKIGKTYRNIMIDLKMNSQKLVERSKKIIMTLCHLTYEDASSLLAESGDSVKTAIVMHFTGFNKQDSEALIKSKNGKIYSIIE